MEVTADGRPVHEWVSLARVSKAALYILLSDGVVTVEQVDAAERRAEAAVLRSAPERAEVRAPVSARVSRVLEAFAHEVREDVPTVASRALEEWATRIEEETRDISDEIRKLGG